MQNLLEHLPADLPEFMTIPYVAKRGLVGYTSVTSVKKLIVNGELESVNLAEEGDETDKLRISRKAIIDYWTMRQEKAKNPSPVKPQRRPKKAPARKMPRKRDK